MMDLIHRPALRLVFLLAAACGQPAADDVPAADPEELRQAVPICPRFTYAREGRCVAAPWAELSADPTNARALTDLQDVDGERIWVVGQGGLLLRSRDGGTTFGRIDTGTAEDLIGVNTYDDRHLLLTGIGRLHISDDGGLHFWRSSPAPSGLGKCGYAPGAAAVCGDRAGGRVYRYDLRRDRFDTVASIPGASRVLTRAGRHLALALGDTGSGTVVMRSRDSGRSFAVVATLPYSPVSLWIAGNDRLALVGTQAGRIYRSTDGGASFALVHDPIGNIDLSIYAAHVSGADPLHVFAAVQIGRGFRLKTPRLLVMRSTDGGATWAEGAEVDDGAGVADFGSPKQGLLLGARILRSDDGGTTATVVDQQAFDPWPYSGFGPVRFISPALGFVGYREAPTSIVGPARTVLARTTDGGLTFTPVYWGRVLPSGGGGLGSLATPDARHLFVDAGAGIARSSDGGDTWVRLMPPAGTGSPFAFATPRLGLFAATGGAAPLYRTTDAGDTFSPVALPAGIGVTAVAFADQAHAIVLGTDGSILYSEDGGRRFRVVRAARAGETLAALAFAGSRVGWAGGGAGGSPLLLKTHDFGRSWTRQRIAGAVGTIVTLAAGSALQAGAILMDDRGGSYLFETEDGETWRPVSTPGSPYALSIDPVRRTTYLGTAGGVFRGQGR
jgi:photosystem II stability/assembly factor-like uncharacterized protein